MLVKRMELSVEQNPSTALTGDGPDIHDSILQFWE